MIKLAEFITSSTKLDQCPPPNLPEYAFWGRSNVGKSSLINMLTNLNKLAKVSVKPGKTQLINHFKIDNKWYLVDLPGFGYAKTSKTDRKEWDSFIKRYLLKRTNLQCVFMLIDARLEPQNIDLEYLEWLGVNQIPFVLTFTKLDKVKPNIWQKNFNKFEQQFLFEWEELPQVFETSAKSKKGKDEILNFVTELNEKFKEL
ncbi:MAG: YihA family ribosome biogenesis GTP-binding protein [Bacteroidetes bacterium]|nr:MAG: YihA family ribosome biogenesis GTP-binding protein [Bacteroidota bacterium]